MAAASYPCAGMQAAPTSRHLPCTPCHRPPPATHLIPTRRRRHAPCNHPSCSAICSTAHAFDLPPSILQGIATANQQWTQEALQQPLVEPDLDAQILLLGVTHFAPLQQQAVQGVLSQVVPQAVALAIPASVGPQDVLLPYPQALQLIMDLHDAVITPHEPLSPAAQHLLSELEAPDLQPQLRLGRDMMDPYEVIGYYPAIDYAVRPAQVAAAVRVFGWMPGQECAEAMQWATRAGTELALVDASVRMQEAWVSGLVSQWSLSEADLGRQLGLELSMVQQLVPAAHTEWDRRLAQEMATGSTSELDMLCAFKISRACAAALLPPDQANQGKVSPIQGAVERQARLQPLKYALFERQALHMATQLKELCRRRASAQTVKCKAAAEEAKAGGEGGGEEKRENVRGGAQPFTVLAVVGRQYVPTIRRLWGDKRSALWKTDVPRTFAPSTVEPVPKPVGEIDPDTAAGGSRPVGQKPLNLGQALGGQQTPPKQ